MRIAMVSEGTYPYAINGVSVWCDQVMQGMPEHEWEMVALTVDGGEKPLWAAPPNLRAVHEVPVWEARPWGRASGGPDPEFRAAFASLLGAMLRPANPGSRAARLSLKEFAAALRRLHDHAEAGGDLAADLGSDAALRLIVDSWRTHRSDPVSLHDAVNAAWLLEHLLRPMRARPPRVDLVHASMNGLSMLVAMAAKWRHGTPIVMSEHGVYLRERYLDRLDDMTGAVRMLLLAFYRQLTGAGYLIADALAPHAQHNRRWQVLGGADPLRIRSVYNGVEPDEFPEPAAEPDAPTIVYMGRIDPIKDLHTLIRAFALVRAEIPNARLRVFGDTAAANSGYRNSCATLIAELGLAGAATLEGRVARQIDAYHQGHVVVLTSISEGFPYTVVEAMACGRPVVCTNVGGVAEAVGGGGFVTPARDHRSIAKACVRLLRDDELRARLGRAARQRVHDNFTLAGSLDAYRRIYDDLTHTSAAARLIPHGRTKHRRRR